VYANLAHGTYAEIMNWELVIPITGDTSLSKIDIFMEHLGSLERLSRGHLQHCFLWQYQVIYHHFSYILFTATLPESANIDFSKDT